MLGKTHGIRIKILPANAERRLILKSTPTTAAAAALNLAVSSHEGGGWCCCWGVVTHRGRKRRFSACSAVPAGDTTFASRRLDLVIQSTAPYSYRQPQSRDEQRWMGMDIDDIPKAAACSSSLRPAAAKASPDRIVVQRRPAPCNTPAPLLRMSALSKSLMDVDGKTCLFDVVDDEERKRKRRRKDYNLKSGKFAA